MAKKGNNDGLFKRPGRPFWQVDTTYRGVRIARGTGCENKQEARQRVRQWKAEIDKLKAGSRLSTNSRLTLKLAAAKWWGEHRQYTGGAKDAKSKVAKLVDLAGPETPLEELSTATAAQLVATMRENGSSPGTIIWYLTTLRSIWGYAQDVWEYPVRSIAWNRVRPKKPEREPVKITVDQANKLLGNCTGRLSEVVKFALLTGMRRNELKTLERKSVILNAHEVVVTNLDGSQTKRRMSVVRLKGKGGKVAEIPLNTAAASLLSSMPERPSQMVFDMVNFRKEWDAARTGAGLQHITFHSLRHAHATILDDMNAPIQGIKRLLRHSDMSTTLIYANAEARAALPYLERLGEMFSSSRTKKSNAA